MIMQKKNWGKPFLIFGVIIVTIIAGACTFYFLEAQKISQSQIMLKYVQFKAENLSLDFTFEYPETGWTPVEVSGGTEKYDLVYLRGPVHTENGFATLIHATVRPLESGKTAADLLEAYLKMDSNLPKFKVLHKGAREVGGEKAVSALYEYESFPLFSEKAPPVLLKGIRVYLTSKGRLYELMLETIGSQYDNYAPVFEHVLKTFQFKK